MGCPPVHQNASYRDAAPSGLVWKFRLLHSNSSPFPGVRVGSPSCRLISRAGVYEVSAPSLASRIGVSTSLKTPKRLPSAFPPPAGDPR